MVPVIGIVGGIGSGKSVVAAAMRGLGAEILDADHFGHEALRQPGIVAKLTARWGQAIQDDAGNLDRRKIGRIVFADAAELRFLESVVFPYIEERIRDGIARLKEKPGVRFIVLDAAIMLETGWDRECDKIVFIDCPRELRLARLQANRGWDNAELTRREAVQMSVEEKKKRSDAVIVNDDGMDKVAVQTKEVLERWNVV